MFRILLPWQCIQSQMRVKIHTACTKFLLHMPHCFHLPDVNIEVYACWRLDHRTMCV